MKKQILNLGKALKKEQLKEIKGGTFFHSQTPSGNWCKYNCSGSGASLATGQGQDCYLSLPYYVYNHPTCGNWNGGGSGDGPGRPDIWA